MGKRILPMSREPGRLSYCVGPTRAIFDALFSVPYVRRRPGAGTQSFCVKPYVVIAFRLALPWTPANNAAAVAMDYTALSKRLADAFPRATVFDISSPVEELQ